MGVSGKVAARGARGPRAARAATTPVERGGPRALRDVGPGLLVTVEEAALLLRVGRRLMYELVMRGEMPSLLIGRARRIPRRAVEEYIERRLLATAASTGT